MKHRGTENTETETEREREKRETEKRKTRARKEAGHATPPTSSYRLLSTTSL